MASRIPSQFDIWRNWEQLIQTIKGDLNRLDSVWRYNSIPIVFPENDAAHHGWVTIYSILIHKRLRPEAYSLIGPISTHAASHDVAESVTGDVVRTFKYKTEEIRSAIKKTEKLMMEDFPSEIQDLVHLHEKQLRESNQLKELKYVNDVVKMADFLSIWRYMRREMVRGNQEIIPFYHIMIEDLRNMKNKFSQDESNCFKEEIAGFYQVLINKAHEIARNQNCDDSEPTRF